MKLYRTLAEVQQDLNEGGVDCRSLVEGYLTRIRENEHLNVFLEVYGEEALQRASEIDEKRKRNEAGKLAGLVLAIKDNICYRGHGVSASSRILEGFESLFTATALERLLAEDAIVIGRTGCDEFAMGSSNENSAFGPVRNPLDPERVPGGSSGGSAAAVAGHMCLASLGSDTGGSIRQPASFCGVVGLKPTYGRVSRWGLLAYASSFDQIGPFTHSVEDSALIYEIMAGLDPHDNTSSSEPVKPLAPGDGEKKYRIGYIKEAFELEGLDSGIREGLNALLTQLRADGHEVKPVSFPYLDYVVPTYYILTTAEASSNLSRYDGVRFGYRSEEAGSTEEVFLKSRSEGFGAEVKRRIMLGTFVLSTGYYDAYYTRAMKMRRLIADQTEAMLRECDFILSPTTPDVAFRFGEKSEDPVQMYLSDIYTVHANLAGNPAVSLPIGTHANGMPYGVQLLSAPFSENELLGFGRHIERKYNIGVDKSV